MLDGWLELRLCQLSGISINLLAPITKYAILWLAMLLTIYSVLDSE